MWHAELRWREGRAEGIRKRSGAGRKGRQEAASLNDAVFGQVAELHIAKGFPWAHHSDVRAETLHAGDIVAKAGKEGTEKVSGACPDPN